MGLRAVDTANQRRDYFEAGVGEVLAAVYQEDLGLARGPSPTDDVH